MRQRLLRQVTPSLPADVARRLEDASTWMATRLPTPAAQAEAAPAQQQVQLNGQTLLRSLDQDFTRAFDLEHYYSAYRLDYPTVYCHTLEEFFTSFVSSLDISTQARQAELARLAAQARQVAQEHGGGVYGVNIPGEGCYLNGWLFGCGAGLSAQDALESPPVRAHILATAVHEKLGHGFLSAYSALGQVKTSLGLARAELARQFGLRPSDDPLSSLRRDQDQLVFTVSQLLEEGWATWIETYLGSALLNLGAHPRHSFEDIVEAVRRLPDSLPDHETIRNNLLWALSVLFGPEAQSLQDLHQAVMVVGMLGMQLDDHFSRFLHQPLRYAVGEWLLMLAEAQHGAACVPYTVLIAANVHFDFERISLSDLAQLLGRDPRLHPDARLAALCRTGLQNPGDVAELAHHASERLSFSVPQELRGEASN